MDEYTPFSGDEFNDIFGSIAFIKITSNDDKENYTFPLRDGLNEQAFTDNRGYITGGIKFYDCEYLFQQINAVHNATYLRHVKIPNDALVIAKKDHYSANKIFLLNKTLISELEIWTEPKSYMEHLLKYPQLAKYIKNIPNDLAMKLIEKDPESIKHIEEPTDEMYILALGKRPQLIHFLKKVSFTVLKMLIKTHAHMVWNVKNPTKDEILELIECNVNVLKYKKDIPEDIAETILEKNGLLLEHIQMKTQHMCNIALENNIEAYRFVPFTYKDYQMSVKAVTHNIKLLEFVPPYLMSNELCLPLLRKDPYLIRHIQKPTDEMYLECSKTQPGLISKIKNTSLITDIDPLEIIRVNPKHIHNIENPTYEMYYVAVKKEGKLINIVPEHFQDEAMCSVAVKNDPTALKLIKKQNESICIIALKANIHTFEYVIDKTNKIFEYVLKIKPSFIKDAQDMIKDATFLDNMITMCLNVNGLLLQYIKEPTYDHCCCAVKQNYKALQHVPEMWNDSIMANIALLENPLALEFVKNQNKQMCEDAVEEDSMAIEFVQEQFLTEAMWFKAIKKNYRALGLNKTGQTIEMCLYAIHLHPQAINYIHNIKEEHTIFLWAMNPKITHNIWNPQLKKRFEETESYILLNISRGD